MLTIIFSWIALFLIIYFIGRLVKSNLDWFEYFWVGLVVVIGILQVWSIFLPVNIVSLVFICLLGATSAIIHRKIFKTIRFNLKFILYSGLILLIISYFSSLSVGWEDTFLYHLNAVKWSNSYPVVPGLANLHSRLGLNSSLFVFASMIDNWIFKDRSSHVALSLLASVLSIQLLWIFLKTKDRVIKIFSILLLPIFLTHVARTTLVASLSPDFAVLILSIVISLEVLKGGKTGFFIAGLLSILLITLKFSGTAFAGLIILFTVYELKNIKTFIIPGIFLLAPFIARGVILSGWPFYPLPLFGFNTAWAVPKSEVVAMYTVIKTWAISPGPGWSNSVGLPFWQWFPGWVTRNNWAIEMKMFFFSLSLLFIAPLVNIFSSGFVKRYKSLLLIGAASLVSNFYMIFTAPDFRFGQIYFWTFAASVITIFVDTILTKNPNLKIPFVISGLYFIFIIVWPIRVDSEPILKSVRWEQSFPVKEVVITPKDGSQPFKVFEPSDEEDLCGNSPLPCTPYPQLPFKEIVPGDISKGYTSVN